MLENYISMMHVWFYKVKKKIFTYTILAMAYLNPVYHYMDADDDDDCIPDNDINKPRKRTRREGK